MKICKYVNSPLSPTEATARDLYKKVQSHVSERIGYTSGKIFTLDVI